MMSFLISVVFLLNLLIVLVVALALTASFGLEQVVAKELRWCESELRWDEKSWDQLRRCEKSWEEFRRCKNRMRWADMSCEELRGDERSWEELRRAEMRWDELRRDDVKRDEKSWVETSWHEQNGEEMSWDELRWAAKTSDELRKGEKSWDDMRRHEKPRSAEKSWKHELTCDGITHPAVTIGCSEQFKREAVMRWGQMKSKRIQHSKDLAPEWQVKSCCEGQKACPHPIGTFLAPFYRQKTFQFETSASELPGYYLYYPTLPCTA